MALKQILTLSLIAVACGFAYGEDVCVDKAIQIACIRSDAGNAILVATCPNKLYAYTVGCTNGGVLNAIVKQNSDGECVDATDEGSKQHCGE